jgi:predicted dehydrogenase
MTNHSSPLRIGLIGLGKMGRIRANEIGKRDDCVLVIGSDPAEGLHSQYPGIETHTDARAVLEADVDAVFVCTPNRFTPDLVVEALDRGRHVFAEKPPGRTLGDVQRILEAERRNPGRVLKFGFNHRYHAGIMEAKRILDSGRMGDILWMRGVYGKAGGDGFENEWRSQREYSGGGILLDQGIHMIDLFRLFGGEFEEVKSMVTTAYWNVDMEDNAFALLRGANGRIAMLHSSSTQWKHRFSLEIYTTEGFVSVNGILSSTRSYGDETITVARRQMGTGAPMGKPREETMYFDTDPSWELELAEFMDCVYGRAGIAHGTSRDALAAMDLVHRIYGADASWAPEKATPKRRHSSESLPKSNA